MLDFVCVAMIIFVRNHCIFYSVVRSDSASILQRLLKYPPVEDIGTLLDLAVKCRDYIYSGDDSLKPVLHEFSFLEPLEEIKNTEKIKEKKTELKNKKKPEAKMMTLHSYSQ